MSRSVPDQDGEVSTIIGFDWLGYDTTYFISSPVDFPLLTSSLIDFGLIGGGVPKL